MKQYKNAQEAFEDLFVLIKENGVDRKNYRSMFNVGFIIKSPLDRLIKTDWRNWREDYAESEWQWYLSGNPNAEEISKKAKIWLTCMDNNGNVNSNYGYQWSRGDQIEYVVNELTKNPFSRRASISIYDGKETHLYEKDTPCTQYINFYLLHGKLNMNVHMRSNDLYFGFCNDQYCFSKLQEMIAGRLHSNVGTYFHIADDMHIYHDKLNKNIKKYE